MISNVALVEADPYPSFHDGTSPQCTWCYQRYHEWMLSLPIYGLLPLVLAPFSLVKLHPVQQHFRNTVGKSMSIDFGETKTICFTCGKRKQLELNQTRIPLVYKLWFYFLTRTNDLALTTKPYSTMWTIFSWSNRHIIPHPHLDFRRADPLWPNLVLTVGSTV